MPKRTHSRWDSCSSASTPSEASTSRSSNESLSGLQAVAAVSAELKGQLSKPSLDVLSSWVPAPDSLFSAKCPECGYIPAPTLGALSQHMLQHHPEVSEPPRTCYKCGIKVSPIDVEKHFQNHTLLNSGRQPVLPQPMTWHGPQAYRPSSGPQVYRPPPGSRLNGPSSGPQVYRPPPGPRLYRPSSDPLQGHTGHPNAPLRHFYGPPGPWPGEWNQPPPGYWPRQPPGPRWRY